MIVTKLEMRCMRATECEWGARRGKGGNPKALPEMILAVDLLVGFDDDGEDGMRARASLVHQCCSHGPLSKALLHHCVDPGHITHHFDRERFHVHTFVWVLFQIQFLFRVDGKQVTDFFVVDL